MDIMKTVWDGVNWLRIRSNGRMWSSSGWNTWI